MILGFNLTHLPMSFPFQPYCHFDIDHRMFLANAMFVLFVITKIIHYDKCHIHFDPLALAD